MGIDCIRKNNNKPIHLTEMINLNEPPIHKVVFVISVTWSVAKATLVDMKNTLSKSLLLILLVSINPVSAGVYKGVSSDGEVVYSDVPFRQSAEFDAPPVAVLEMPDVILDKVLSEESAKAEKEEEDRIAAEKNQAERGNIQSQAEYLYTQFYIKSPKDKESIWNNPDLEVSLHLAPSLNNLKKHKIWLLLDGKPLVDNSESLSIPTGRLVRGEHKLQAQVRDAKGKLIIKTKSIIVYIHYSSAN